MHTLEELDVADFRYRSDGRPVPKQEVMPAISIDTRVGVVMDHGPAGLGAGTFILASVIEFYDSLREQKEEFFEYPDFYTFQSTLEPTDYEMLDIYPGHKNVVTEPDAEAILRAVNDRAIDILLIPDGSPSSPEIDEVTRRSAERGINACVLYSPDGDIADHDFVVEASRRPIEEWFETIAESAGGTLSDEGWRASQKDQHRIVQRFREVSLDRGFEYLAADHRE